MVMINVELREDIKNLMKNTDFVKEVINAKDADEAINVFKSKGVSITLNELNAIYDFIDKALSLGESGNLDDDTLENISGGVALTAAAIWALVALGGADIGLRVGRRVRNSKANYKDLQAEAETLGAKAYDVVSDKEAKQYEMDSNITIGVEVASLSAALLMLNYHKKDIYKYWCGKKKKMKKSIEAGKNKV